MWVSSFRSMPRYPAVTQFAQIVSRGLNAQASSTSEGSATQANDANYNHRWRSSSFPSWLAYDISALSGAQKSSLLLVWYNGTYGWINTGAGGNMPKDYTIEANAGAGGGSAPGSGWVTLTTVTANTHHSREHVLTLTGYNWVRMNTTDIHGEAGNNDVSIKMDLYSLVGGALAKDGVLCTGDSITANCMGTTDQGATPADSFGNQISTLSGGLANPWMHNAGIGGWTSADPLTTNPGTGNVYFDEWLAEFSGHYVSLNYGTNNGSGGGADLLFKADMLTLAAKVAAAGKKAIIPTIPWSGLSPYDVNVPILNARVAEIYSSHPEILAGPDLYAYFNSNQGYITGGDGLHPSEAGSAKYREQWALWAYANIFH